MLTILSLISTSLAFRLPNVRDRVSLAQADAWLETTLIKVRGQARHDGRARSVEFDWATKRYRLSDAVWRALPSGVEWTLGSGQQATGARSIVTFLPDGSGPGATLVMRAGSLSSTYRVNWLTGSILNVER